MHIMIIGTYWPLCPVRKLVSTYYYYILYDKRKTLICFIIVFRRLGDRSSFRPSITMHYSRLFFTNGMLYGILFSGRCYYIFQAGTIHTINLRKISRVNLRKFRRVTFESIIIIHNHLISSVHHMIRRVSVL